ncbi:MAG: protein kinase [Chloroflexi bacterium]|nr:protein kinase [Chloroflexota bacterium]
MGIVHRAIDRLSGETIALKQVTTPGKLHIAASSDPNAIDSSLHYALAHEFQTLAGLRHPHIISVLDYGFDEEKRPFFTMDYLPEAQTLLEAGQAASQERKIELLQQLLQALAYLHRHDILHRDLKPENVLVSGGVLRVLDFGLSASPSSGSSAGGSYFYLAPEVWAEQPYTFAADLFAVGILAYQLLTGENPFAPLDHAYMDRVLNEDPDLSHLNSNEALVAIIGQLLAKDPIARFASAQKTSAALSAAVEQVLPSVEKLIEEQFVVEEKPTFVREVLEGESLMARLLAVSRQMAEMRTLSPLLLFAIDEVLQLVGAERGYIVLLDEDGQLDFRVRRKRDGTSITSRTDPISRSILDEAINTRQSLVIGNALMDPRFGAAFSVMALRLRSVMCAPLITKNRVIGAIYVENRSRSGLFNQGDLAPLEFFSNQAAVAIENANLNDNLEQLVENRTQQLAEAKEIAETANQAKTMFLSNMSHELRTPLNAILNFTGFVLDGFFGDVNTEQVTALQQVSDSGEHLLSLINDVLDLNKIEAGMMNLMITEVNMNKILQHALSTAKGLMKDKPMELVVDIEEKLPIIRADTRRLRQILLNLISNAVKYTIEGQVTVRAWQEKDSVLISIQDTGIGIAPKDHNLVFESYREASHNIENIMSTGLGLPITKQLVHLHGGDIWFESKIGVGTMFYVRLPI